MPVLPTVAMPVLLLLHVPPAVASDSATVPPTHTLAVAGVIADGFGLTVTVAVTKQVPVV
jgi:tellurite resistance protein TehA-like permease